MQPRDHAGRNRSVARALEVVGDAFMGVTRLERSFRGDAAAEAQVR